jgi:hypothetical protein
MRNPIDNDNDIDEDMKLTRGDYIKILHHYQPSSRNMSSFSAKTVKERAHRILAGKLCRCIKAPSSLKRRNYNEGRRIAYCTRSIYNNKGLRRHGFRCKDSRSVLRPRLTGDITKTRRNIFS